MKEKKPRAPNNRTLRLCERDAIRFSDHVITLLPERRMQSPIEGTICGDSIAWSKVLPYEFADLLILDPPYNLEKTFNGHRFSKMDVDDYTEWLDMVCFTMKPLLKRTATVYICCDWLTSQSAYAAARRHFRVRSRITWEREKGRGASRNWKNVSEDIWFCTVSDDYVFNVDAVKLRRRVIAPYTDQEGQPRDWHKTEDGKFRDTHPSNLWTDITVPFWSMSENTDHPTQKSEKLFAKLILASSNPGDFVFDPFLGSGTSSVVAKKLGRRHLGIEIDKEYCLLAQRRLEIAEECREIQGYTEGVFWERHSAPMRKKAVPSGLVHLLDISEVSN